MQYQLQSQASNLFNTVQKMSSLEISEMMDKEHKNVMRDIRKLVDDGAINQLRSELVEYRDAKGELRPMYLLDFESTMVLITGYDAKRRAIVIDRWLKLERGEAHPLHSIENERIAMQEKIIKLHREKDELWDRVIRLTEENHELLKSVPSPEEVIQKQQRSDMSRFSRMASTYPEIYRKMYAQGVRAISKADYEAVVNNTQIENGTTPDITIDRLMKAEGDLCITDAAKILQIRPNDLFSLLS